MSGLPYPLPLLSLAHSCLSTLLQETLTYFTGIKQQLDEFNRGLTVGRVTLQRHLSELLPEIRGTGQGEQRLAQLVASFHSSFLSKNRTKAFLDAKVRFRFWLSTVLTDLFFSFGFLFQVAELTVLDGYLKTLQRLGATTELAQSSARLDALTTSLDHEYVVCLRLGLASDTNSYLDTLHDLKWADSAAPPQPKPAGVNWFRRDAYARAKIRAFSEFVKRNQDNTNCKFIALDSQEVKSGEEYVSTSLYKDGAVAPVPFFPAKIATKPVCQAVTDHSIQVTWTVPELGKDFISGFTVLCREHKVVDAKWVEQRVGADATSVIIDRLAPGVAYECQVRAETEAGPCPESVTSDTVVTLAKVAPNNQEEQVC